MVVDGGITLVSLTLSGKTAGGSPPKYSCFNGNFELWDEEQREWFVKRVVMVMKEVVVWWWWGLGVIDACACARVRERLSELRFLFCSCLFSCCCCF